MANVNQRNLIWILVSSFTTVGYATDKIPGDKYRTRHDSVKEVVISLEIVESMEDIVHGVVPTLDNKECVLVLLLWRTSELFIYKWSELG